MWIEFGRVKGPRLLKRAKVRVRVVIISLGLGVLLASCSGYKVASNDNPLKNYGIKSVAVPMFVNKSIFPQVNAHYASAIIKELMSYRGLEVHTGEKEGVDAVLLGIVYSSQQYKEAVEQNNRRYLQDGTLRSFAGVNPKNSDENRTEFFITQNSRVNLKLRLILIKDPYVIGALEQEKLPSHISRALPKTIFDETTNIRVSFNRPLFRNTNPDRGGSVIYTNEKRYQDEAFIESAQAEAIAFKEVLLNAF